MIRAVKAAAHHDDTATLQPVVEEARQPFTPTTTVFLGEHERAIPTMRFAAAHDLRLVSEALRTSAASMPTTSDALSDFLGIRHEHASPGLPDMDNRDHAYAAPTTTSSPSTANSTMATSVSDTTDGSTTTTASSTSTRQLRRRQRLPR